jgi:predicted N-acetyltransferase YhbS
VNPAYFGNGIGRRLVQWGLDQAEQDQSDCYLETMLKNEVFYQKLGFQTIGWQKLEAKEAPDGFVDWPYMIKTVVQEA